MPGWFIAFLLLLFLVLAIVILVLWRRWSRHSRSRSLAEDYAQNLSGAFNDLIEGDSLQRLRQGTLLWKHAFAPPLGGYKRSLRRVILIGSETVMVSKRVAHRASHVRRPLTEADTAIPLREILALELGPPERLIDVFAGRDRKDLCFRLLTKQRSYEFEALVNDDFCDWVFGLQKLLAEQQRWAGLPQYDGIQLAEAQKNMVRGFKLPAAFEFSSMSDLPQTGSQGAERDPVQTRGVSDYYRAPQAEQVIEIDTRRPAPKIGSGGGGEVIVELDCKP
eukprot:Hpha_TRINITY_DN21093_c0_g1::TRINITY_DN21093_c0_g1_i1::g.103430::m.103430